MPRACTSVRRTRLSPPAPVVTILPWSSMRGEQRHHVAGRPVDRHEGEARRRRIGAGANEPDHFIDVRNRDRVADQQMRALASLGEIEAAAAEDHLLAERHETLQHFLQAHGARTAMVQRQHVAAERNLHVGETEKLVQHHFRRVASRRSSITTRMPWRSLSSRMSPMPSICLARTSSAMRSCKVALFTW